MDAPIEFSREALEAFERRFGDRGIRLGVRGGACEGLQYVIELDDGPYDSDRDVVWNVCDAVFVVDRKSLCFLTGSRVVWVKTLMREGFEFENPNEASRCGCGRSFEAK